MHKINIHILAVQGQDQENSTIGRLVQSYQDQAPTSQKGHQSTACKTVSYLYHHLWRTSVMQWNCPCIDPYTTTSGDVIAGLMPQLSLLLPTCICLQTLGMFSNCTNKPIARFTFLLRRSLAHSIVLSRPGVPGKPVNPRSPVVAVAQQHDRS